MLEKDCTIYLSEIKTLKHYITFVDLPKVNIGSMVNAGIWAQTLQVRTQHHWSLYNQSFALILFDNSFILWQTKNLPYLIYQQMNKWFEIDILEHLRSQKFHPKLFDGWPKYKGRILQKDLLFNNVVTIV